MAEVTALMVKSLRGKSGAGMMDCKKALNETGGDIEAAVDWLRKKGLAAAAKKAGRVAAEGLIAVAEGKNMAAVVEVNAETDFVARNPEFQSMVAEIAKKALTADDSVEALAATAFEGEGGTVEGEVKRMVGVIGENMNLRRSKLHRVENGVVASYIHNAVAPGLGKIGVLVALESSADTAKLHELGKKLAMHVAAASPIALSVDSVDQEAVARERQVLEEQARASGRPENVIEKMVEGRIRKFYEEVVFLEQVFVMDGKAKVSEFVEAEAKAMGAEIKVAGFTKFTIGEGIEKEESDFAAEVAAQAGVK